MSRSTAAGPTPPRPSRTRSPPASAPPSPPPVTDPVRWRSRATPVVAEERHLSPVTPPGARVTRRLRTSRAIGPLAVSSGGGGPGSGRRDVDGHHRAGRAHGAVLGVLGAEQRDGPLMLRPVRQHPGRAVKAHPPQLSPVVLVVVDQEADRRSGPDVVQAS